MKLQENKIDWAALNEITDRILDHATSPRSVKKVQNEYIAEGGPCAVDSQRPSNAVVAKDRKGPE